jgi:hypothetical protein
MDDDQHQEIVEYLLTALEAIIKINSELKRLDANKETRVCGYRARGAIGNALVALDAHPIMIKLQRYFDQKRPAVTA